MKHLVKKLKHHYKSHLSSKYTTLKNKTNSIQEEIQDLFFKLPSFQNISENFTVLNPMTLVPKPKQSLAILLVCLIVLLLSIAVAACKYWWFDRRHKGYSQPTEEKPPEKKQSSKDVIAEVVNRREQVSVQPSKSQPVTPTKQLPEDPNSLAKSTKSAPSSTVFIDPEGYYTPRKMNESPPTAREPFNQKTNLNNFALLSECQKSTKHLKPRENLQKSVESCKLQQLAKDDKSKPSTSPETIANQKPNFICPLNPPKPLKLIPYESLTIPKRTFDDAIRQSDPEKSQLFDIDKVLSLTKAEKSRSQSSLVLEPRPTESQLQRFINLRQIPGMQNFVEPPLSIAGDILTTAEKEEERNKFYRACWKNEIRRRRSLCSISSKEDLVDPQLYTAMLKAKKVRSMPSIAMKSFAKLSHPQLPTKYSSDKLVDSTSWSPPLVAHTSQTTSLNFPSGSMASIHEEISDNGIEIFSLPLDRVTAATSKTSVWSTVATENQFDPESEDDTLTDEMLPPIGIEEIFEAKESEEEDPEEDKLSPQFFPSNSDLYIKPSLSTAADFIAQSARSKGFLAEKGPPSDQSLKLESDNIPSEMFQRRISSSDMFDLGGSVSDYFRKNEKRKPTQSEFWEKDLLEEFDPMKISSTVPMQFSNRMW